MGSRLTTERLLERRREDRAFDEAQYRRSVCEQRKND
jgi:hypothetical protein